MTQYDTVYSYLRHAFIQYVLILCMTIDAAWGVMFLDCSSACVCVHVSGIVSDRHVVDCTYCLCSGIVLPCQTESVETELPVTQGFDTFARNSLNLHFKNATPRGINVKLRDRVWCDGMQWSYLIVVVGTAYIVCRTQFHSVCLSISFASHTVGLLLWVGQAEGDTDWLLPGTNAGSATLSADVGSWRQTCLHQQRLLLDVAATW